MKRSTLAAAAVFSGLSLCMCLSGCGKSVDTRTATGISDPSDMYEVGLSHDDYSYEETSSCEDYPNDEAAACEDYDYYEDDSSEYEVGHPYDDSSYTDESGTYSLSQMSMLNGVFIMRPSEDKLIELPEEIDHRNIDYIDGATKLGISGKVRGAIGSTYDEPLVVDRAKEKLVLLGYEGGNRAEASKDRISVRNGTILGYTAKYLMDDRFDPTDVEDLTGADIITFSPTTSITKEHTMVSDTKGATCTYGEYVGTTFLTRTEEMLNPVYYFSCDDALELNVILTRDGYFEIDLSTLNPGMYVLLSYSGLYPFVVE